MIYNIVCDGQPCGVIGTDRDVEKFSAWVDSLPPGHYASLGHLLEHGWEDQPHAVCADIEACSPPTAELQRVANRIMHYSRQAAQSVVISTVDAAPPEPMSVKERFKIEFAKRGFTQKYAENCGTGEGGFKPGNTCAGEGGLSVDTSKFHKTVQTAVSEAVDLFKESFPGLGDPKRKFGGIKFLPIASAEHDAFSHEVRMPSHGLEKEIRPTNPEGVDSKLLIAPGLKGTLIHELSHAVDSNIKLNSSDEQKDRWFDLKKSLEKDLGSPSEYGKKNTSEWFAERMTAEMLGMEKPVLLARAKEFFSDSTDHAAKKYRLSDDVNAAAAETCEPTDAQKESGNYRKGKVRLHGLEISIENPKGTRRKPDWPELGSHYGYINRTEGKDGDHVDCFIGPHPESEVVFVIDQVTEGGKFDEHKVMIGWTNEAKAKAAYLENYSPGWRCGPVTAMTIDQFKAWLKSGDQGERVEKQVSKYKKDRLWERKEYAKDAAGHEHKPPGPGGGQFTGHGGGAGSTLSSEEKASVRGYKQAGGYSINRFLRTGGAASEKAKADISRMISDIDSAISKASSIEGKTLYRGVGVMAWLDGSFPDPKTLKVGDTFKDKGFMSSSEDKKNALEFADGPEDIVLEIVPGRNLKGLPTDQFAENQRKENEYLLPRNSRMTVKKISKINGKTLVSVAAEQVEENQLESDSSSHIGQDAKTSEKPKKAKEQFAKPAVSGLRYKRKST